MKAYLDIVLDEVTRVLHKIDDASSRAFVRELARCKSIYITGVGRSGLVVQAFGQRLMHLGFDVHLAHEITAPAIRRGDLLVACSGTGTTLLPHYMARKARRIHARVVCLTARPTSPLAKISNLTVPIPAPLERGPETRQPARSLFEQVLFLYLDSVILTAMHELRIPGRKIRRRHANLE
ncbi:MAG TPA: 6-phospho-3-hexuloisomerase [Planctomycetota bacterium]|nr:6-phospho-3-hexuloisomerase [Planctomycetota bacterium]